MFLGDPDTFIFETNLNFRRKAIDNPAQLFQLRIEDACRGFVFDSGSRPCQQQLGLALKDRQRRSQFMRCIGDELPKLSRHGINSDG